MHGTALFAWSPMSRPTWTRVKPSTLLPEVAWSWLVDALTARTDQVRALGGTVTATTSVRYGDISAAARSPAGATGVMDGDHPDLGAHVQAFCDVLEHAAGLPPAGVTDLGSRSRA